MSFDFQVNAAWLTAAMAGQILLAWLKLLALDGDLARAELRTGAAPRRPAGARGPAAPPEIRASWPWGEAITAAWRRIGAIPQAP